MNIVNKVLPMYEWFIEEDLINTPDPDDEENEQEDHVHIQGPRDAGRTRGNIMVFGRKFRLSDDDNIPYYIGYFADFSSGLDDGLEEITGFEPLMDFGMPAAGCTKIEYWDTAKEVWEVL